MMCLWHTVLYSYVSICCLYFLVVFQLEEVFKANMVCESIQVFTGILKMYLLQRHKCCKAIRFNKVKVINTQENGPVYDVFNPRPYQHQEIPKSPHFIVNLQK